MPLDLFNDAIKGVDILEAREQILNLKASDWPKVDAKDRAKYIDQLNRAAFPESQKTLRLDEIDQLFKR